MKKISLLAVLSILVSISSAFAERGIAAYPLTPNTERPIAAIISKTSPLHEGKAYFNPFDVTGFYCDSWSGWRRDLTSLSLKVRGSNDRIPLIFYGVYSEGTHFQDCQKQMNKLQALVNSAQAKKQYLLLSNPDRKDVNYENEVITVPSEVYIAPSPNQNLDLH